MIWNGDQDNSIYSSSFTRNVLFKRFERLSFFMSRFQPRKCEKSPHLFHDRLTTSLSGHVEGQQEGSSYGRGCPGKKPNMSVSLSSGFRGINAKNGYEQSFRNSPYRNLSVSL